MDLFNQEINSHKNRLPYNGCVHYFGRIYTLDESNRIYRQLLENIEWKHDEAIMYGKHIVTKRKIAWYAIKPYAYTYSGIVRKALPFTKLLLTIKQEVEKKTGVEYNSCLLNLYHDGSEGMAWHADDEKELRTHSSIASLSFGAIRKFALKHNKTKEKVEFLLYNGDLLEMKNETQSYWKHTILKTKKVNTPRISLTFRQMEESVLLL